MPLLPMLEKEACAQFYGDKNMWRNAARDRVLLLSILFKNKHGLYLFTLILFINNYC